MAVKKNCANVQDSECDFCIAGHIVNRKRARLNTESVKILAENLLSVIKFSGY